MTDASAAFFDRIARLGHEPLLEKATGTVRVDLADGDRTARWYVVVDRGDLTVSRTNGAADLTMRTDRKVFDRLASGEANPMTALLRGEIDVEGSWELLVLFRRLFPGSGASAEGAAR